METKNYTEKFEELTKILKELERGDITIDNMTLKIQQALVLLDECKESLSKVNEDVNKIREEIKFANER
ncbi:MAG: exodeoxyribonuclease VII small subunit [Bacteroidales bacterium]|nr:exodeoxyribonuclease VII small subunit [Bacteroidales bacterium]